MLRSSHSNGSRPLSSWAAACALVFGVAACGDSTTSESPTIVLSSGSVALQAPAAGDVQTAELSISNAGGGTLGSPTIDLTYATPQVEDWLTVEVDSPTSPSTLSFSATPPVRPGTYQATVAVSEANGDSEAEVAVTLTVAARPLLYMIDHGEDRLRRMDPATLTITEVGPLGLDVRFGACTWDPQSERLLATAGRPSNTLLEVDLVTGSASVIGTHGVDDLFSLEWHPPSQGLYGWKNSTPRALQRIDPSTAAATQIADPFGRVDALAWDSDRLAMVGFGTNVGPDGGSVFSVDLAAGTTTLVTRMPSINNMGATYDPVRDLFWLVDIRGQVITLDPANGFASDIVATLQGENTCIAYVP